MSLREYWYIACASAKLGASPRAVRVLDRDLVVFRGEGGAPCALLDRCCHRGVKLSLGRVHEGRLACGYHGWQFDSSGACVFIPSLHGEKQIPAGCSVPAFPCVEQDGYVWVWLSDKTPSSPPCLEGFEEHRWLQGEMPMNCHFSKGLENSLDWCHAVFTHPWTHGQFYLTLLQGLRKNPFAPFARLWRRDSLYESLLQGLTTQQVEIVPTEDGLIVRGPKQDDGKEPLVTLTFRLPCRAEVAVSGRAANRIILHFVPTGEDRCRMEWLMTSWRPFGPRVRWVEKENSVLQQDRLLLESISSPPGAQERSVEADAPALLLRRILDWAARGEWEEKRATLPEKRTIQVRA